MLMLGVFNSILTSRTSQQEFYSSALKTLKKKTTRKYSYYLNKKNGLEELDDLFVQETRVESNNAEELAFIALLDENMKLIEHEIYRALGTYEERLTEKAISNISKRSSRLAQSYDTIALEMRKRKSERPTVFDDVLLLEYCGEASEELFRIYEPNQQQIKFDKLLQHKK